MLCVKASALQRRKLWASAPPKKNKKNKKDLMIKG
jgi:hypothetical protein